MKRVHEGKAPITEPLKDIFGSQRTQLSSHWVTCSSRELTRALVGEAVHQLNSSLLVVISNSPSGSSSPLMSEMQYAMAVAEKMMRVISDTMQKIEEAMTKGKITHSL